MKIRFERGRSSIVLRGKLPPCDNRIYKFRARQGQNISVALRPMESNLVFWVQGLKAGLLQEIGKGGVTEWSGKLPETDEYEIYVSTPPVQNSEQTRLSPFRLKIEIN